MGVVYVVLLRSSQLYPNEFSHKKIISFRRHFIFEFEINHGYPWQCCTSRVPLNKSTEAPKIGALRLKSFSCSLSRSAEGVIMLLC